MEPGQATAEGDHDIRHRTLGPDRAIAVEIDPPTPNWRQPVWAYSVRLVISVESVWIATRVRSLSPCPGSTMACAPSCSATQVSAGNWLAVTVKRELRCRSTASNS